MTAIWEKSVPELLSERFEANKLNDDSKINLINEILEQRREEAERQERREEAERKEKERQDKVALDKLKLASTSNFAGAIDNFIISLRGTGISSPDTRVLDTLVRRFPLQVSLVARDPSRALDLYLETKALPSTTTTAQMENESQIYLNGPLGAENINILIGSKSDKTPVVVKILVAANHTKLSYAQLSAACQKEAQVCMRLDLSRTTLPFVRSEVVNISSDIGVSRKAIVMPMYVRTVADSARLWPASLNDGTLRIMQALEHMHGLNLVHMDVKGSNIFIDQGGDWYLGDFGSTCDSGEAVITTTPSFYPNNLCGLPAHPKYDWFMLLVTILIELMPKKHEWAKELCETETKIVTLPLVAQALQNAITSEDVSELLKPLLSEMAERSELF